MKEIPKTLISVRYLIVEVLLFINNKNYNLYLDDIICNLDNIKNLIESKNLSQPKNGIYHPLYQHYKEHPNLLIPVEQLIKKKIINIEKYINNITDKSLLNADYAHSKSGRFNDLYYEAISAKILESIGANIECYEAKSHNKKSCDFEINYCDHKIFVECKFMANYRKYDAPERLLNIVNEIGEKYNVSIFIKRIYNDSKRLDYDNIYSVIENESKNVQNLLINKSEFSINDINMSIKYGYKKVYGHGAPVLEYSSNDYIKFYKNSIYSCEEKHAHWLLSRPELSSKLSDKNYNLRDIKLIIANWIEKNFIDINFLNRIIFIDLDDNYEILDFN